MDLPHGMRSYIGVLKADGQVPHNTNGGLVSAYVARSAASVTKDQDDCFLARVRPMELEASRAFFGRASRHAGESQMARYDMPAMFGPSLLPDQSKVAGTFIASIGFETERAAVQHLLPRFFEVAETPVVTLTYIDYPALDYLGGRGYHELVVAVAATFTSADEEIRAGFAPVMWVDQVGALISGREYMGYGKLLGGFDADRDQDRVRFRCSEYGAALVDGTATGLKQVSEEGLARINAGAKHVNSFGWKYISGDGDTPDADYPLVNVMRWEYTRAWSGEGRLDFHAPSATDAPLSSRIVAALSALPVVAWRRSFVAEGNVVIDRAGTRRLCPEQVAA